jgi:hypothetical protein
LTKGIAPLVRHTCRLFLSLVFSSKRMFPTLKRNLIVLQEHGSTQKAYLVRFLSPTFTIRRSSLRATHFNLYYHAILHLTDTFNVQLSLQPFNFRRCAFCNQSLVMFPQSIRSNDAITATSFVLQVCKLHVPRCFTWKRSFSFISCCFSGR